MTQNNNFSVLPFYKVGKRDIVFRKATSPLQNHRKDYAYGNIYPLYASDEYFIPFQLQVDNTTDVPFRITYTYVDGREILDYTKYFTDAGLKVVKNTAPNEDTIVFPANVPLGLKFAKGQYCLQIMYGDYIYVSDVFTIVDDMSQYLKIEWWDEDNLVFDAGQIIYKNPSFKNRLYLCTEVGKPDYEFEEEGEERDGYFFAEKQISKKVYNFTALAPEYLCDVMRYIRMSDHVVITDHLGRVYECDTFLMTPQWQGNGDVASIECQFTTDTIVKKVAKGYGI